MRITHQSDGTKFKTRHIWWRTFGQTFKSKTSDSFTNIEQQQDDDNEDEEEDDKTGLNIDTP